MDTLSVYYVWSFFVHSQRRGSCDWNKRQTLGTHPDFIAMNYYSTATIGVSRGDGTDVAAGAGDQQRMYKNEKKTHEKKTQYGHGKNYSLGKDGQRYHDSGPVSSEERAGHGKKSCI